MWANLILTTILLQVINKNKELLEECAPSFASAQFGNRSSAITPCCPPFVQAGMFITFSDTFAAAVANRW